MEISKLEKSIMTYNKTVDIPNVSILLKDLKKLDLNDIVDVLNTEFNKIECDIIKIYHSDRENKIELLGSYVNESIKYLKDGISFNNTNYILIFFRLIRILPLYVVDLFKFKKISEEELQYIENEIFKFLRKFNFKMIAWKNIDFNEIFNKGFNNENISSVKQIIHIINNHYEFNFKTEIISNLIHILKDLNFDLIIKLILESDNLHKALFFLKKLDEEQIILISKNDDTKDKWLVFGIIDKILEFYNEEDDEIKIILGDLIYKVKDDFNFFKQLIINYNNNSLFNASLGYLLPKLTSSEFKKTVEECFIINKYSFAAESKENFLKTYHEFSKKEDYYKFLNLIFLKWEDFLEDCFYSEDYLIDIVLTDFANFILQYYFWCSSDEEVIDQMVKCLEFLNNIDTVWSSSCISLSNKFCINLSKLYILSFIYDFNELDDKKVNKLFLEFDNNEILKNKFSIREKEKYYEKLKENILKLGD